MAVTQADTYRCAAFLALDVGARGAVVGEDPVERVRDALGATAEERFRFAQNRILLIRLRRDRRGFRLGLAISARGQQQNEAPRAATENFHNNSHSS